MNEHVKMGANGDLVDFISQELDRAREEGYEECKKDMAVGFILFLIVFIALMVAFSASIGWFIVFVLACYAIVAVVRIIRYSQLPDYDKYLSQNMNVYNDGQLHCCNCGSSQLMHVGLFGLRSKLRYYVCMNCRKH